MSKIYKYIIARILIIAMIFQCIPLQFVFAADNSNLQNIPVPLDSELNTGIMMLNEEQSTDSLNADFDDEENKMQAAENKLTDEDVLMKNFYLSEPAMYSTDAENTEKDGKEVFKEGNSVYASGIPILIKKENDKIYIYDKSGTNRLLEEPIDASVTIFGGGKDVSVDFAEIIMQDGVVAGIVGGGRNGSVLNDSKITLTGGNVTGLICGGGREEGASVNNTYITVTGDVTVKWIYGGGYYGDVLRDTNISLNGGKFSYVCGGGFQGNVKGNTELEVNNCNISDTVFSGGWRGKVDGSTNLILKNSTAQYICGGGYLTDKDGSDSTVGQNTEINILNSNILEKVYGGGWVGDVIGSTKVTLSEGTAENLYGGGYEGAVNGSTNVNMTGGNVTATVFGGGQKETAEVKEVYCTLSGGTIGFLYGGGWKAKTNGDISILLSGTVINNIAFGGGYFNTAEVNNTEITASNGSSAEVIYGGGENAPVLGSTSLFVDGGKVTNLYGGGRNTGSDVSGNSDINIVDGDVNFLYGGGNYSNILSSNIKVSGGIIQSLYGGASEGIVQNTNIEFNDGNVGWIYGGGKDGSVIESNVKINGGKILYNVFGGGRNSSADVNKANVIINGGSINNVFGGGDKGNVFEKNSISILTQGSINFVSGGGYSGSSKEISIKLSDGEIKTLYGGGYAGNAENVSIDILNGDVSQFILGSGTNGVSKNCEVHVYGGIIRDLYSGYYNEIKIYYSGGSILLNRPEIALDKQNNTLYKTNLFIGDTPIADKLVKCKFDNSSEWYSKTDSNGKLVVYLPLIKVNITVEDEESGNVYTGSVIAEENKTASFTLLQNSNEEEYTVSFNVKSGSGNITAASDISDVVSGDVIKKGEKVTFKAVPNSNFYIENWFYNGEPLNITDDTYVIEGITESANIEVAFAKNVVDFEPLKLLIETAESIKSDVAVSIDGNDLETNQKWVTRTVMKEFQNVLINAKTVINNTETSQKDVDEAVNDLEMAIQLFEDNIKYGNGIADTIDRSSLNKLITFAEDAKLGIFISIDGSDIDKEQKWVTQEIMDRFNSIINEAENIADSQSVTQQDIDSALNELENAVEIFTLSQKYGEKQLKFKVEFNSVGNGSIEAYNNGNLIENPYMALTEDIILFKAVPENGYIIDYWTKNGSKIEINKDTFELKQIKEQVNISVYFKKDDSEVEEKYFVNLSDNIKNGLISVSENGAVAPGTIVHLNAFPDDGYYLLEKSLKYNGIVVDNNSFVMPSENVLITAEFLLVNKSYILTVVSDAGGTVFGSGNFKEGEEIYIKAIADSGYRFEKWESQYENYIKDIYNNETAVIMPGNNITVRALFKPSGGSSGSSGDSSSNNESYNNTNTTTKPLVVTKTTSLNVKTEADDDSVTAVLYADATPDTSGNCYINIQSSDMSKAIEATAKYSDTSKVRNLKISLNTDINILDFESVHFVLPENAADFYDIENYGQLYFDTPIVSLNIEQRALKSIFSQGKGSIQFSISKIENLSDEASEMIEDRPAFEFFIISDHKQINAFGGGQITIYIPYKIKEQEEPENITGCYIDKNGKASIWKDSVYNITDKFLEIKTTHFSGFGVTLLSNAIDKQVQQTKKIFFNDINGHWAEEDIIKMADKGIISGMTDSDFMPDECITRGMFITILGRASNVSEEDYSSCDFNDVSIESYYMPYIAWASENNIAAGTGNNNFSPDVLLTREEMAVILYNYMIYENKNISETKDIALFKDDSKISSWAKDSVYSLQKAGLLFGKNNNIFEPDMEATRAEAAVLINRVLELTAISE